MKTFLISFLIYIKKNWVILSLLAIIAGAIFVRTYNFNSWLYFKMDQSRDALMIGNAVENGPQYLPLLGPRVGAVKLEHGMLRVGPIFYYFQYVSGVIFNSTKAYVFAYPDLLFSILAIPLLYFFVRLYFSKRNSLLITMMYAFSFLIIQYSRFAWNPNSMQFFILLSFYGLLKFFNENREKSKRKWLSLWAFGIAIGAQLHFFGFFSLLGISGLMFLYYLEPWKKENWIGYFKKEALKKFAIYVGISMLIFSVLYSPVIISDVFKNGQNTHNFFEALGSKAESKPISEKIIKGATENIKYYCLLTTSQYYGSEMKKEIPALLFSVGILIIGILICIRGLRKEKNHSRRNFLVLIIIWLGVFSILTIPVSFQLRPRFFIVVFALPFIFMGLLFEYLEERINKKMALTVSLLLTLGVVIWNSYGTYQWFKEQSRSQKSAFTVKRTLILKAKDGVTLGQLQSASDWMYSQHKKGATLYFYVKPEHVRPLQFLFWEKKDKDLVYKPIILNEDPNAQYFALVPAKNGLDNVYAKYGKDIAVIGEQQFGQLRAYEISFNNRKTSQEFRFSKSKDKTDRIFWKDVFKTKTDPNAIIIDSAE